MTFADRLISDKVTATQVAYDLGIFLRKEYEASVALAKQEVSLIIAVKELKLELTKDSTITPGLEGLTDSTKLKLNMATGGKRNIGLINPLVTFAAFTSAFGPRGSRMHFGLDMASPIANKRGSLVVAAAEGQVVYVGNWGAGGNTVMVYHSTGAAQGHTTVYMHLATISVRLHQVVKQGQILGREGSSGGDYGRHLHFEVQIGRGPQYSSDSPSPEALSRISYTPSPTYIHGKGYSKVIAAQDPRWYLP